MNEEIRYINISVDGNFLVNSLRGLLEFAATLEDKSSLVDNHYKGPHPQFVAIALSMTLSSLVNHGMYPHDDVMKILDEAKANLTEGPRRKS